MGLELQRYSMKSMRWSIFVFALFSAGIVVAQQTPAPSSAAPSTSKPASTASAPRKTDRASAYYHYTVAHMYEDQFAVYNRSDLATKAIEEYRLAIDADPTSEYLTSGLAELYAKTGRIRDAVLEAQDILKKDPDNLEAHKLLGRIYLRSLGDVQSGSGSDSVL
jgi:Flp pilus assembly protein TadD